MCRGPQLLAAVVLLAVLGCPRPAPESEGVTLVSLSGDTSTGDPCPYVPPCELCPESQAELCGLACDDADAACGDGFGGGMTCAQGVWVCAPEPPVREGCGACEALQSCANAGCSSGVELELFPPGSGVVAGTYRVQLVQDGLSSTCTFVISDAPSCRQPPCVVDTTCAAKFELAGRPPRIAMSLPISTSLAITVERDDATVLDAEPELDYELARPNGLGCTPVCLIANVRLDVD